MGNGKDARAETGIKFFGIEERGRNELAERVQGRGGGRRDKEEDKFDSSRAKSSKGSIGRDLQDGSDDCKRRRSIESRGFGKLFIKEVERLKKSQSNCPGELRVLK